MSWFLGWLIDATPWWAWLLAVGALLAATYQLWAPLWALTPQPLKIGLGAVAAALAAYLAGRNRGAAGALARAQAEQDAARQRAIKARQEIDHEVDALAPADLDRDLAKWMRRDDG